MKILIVDDNIDLANGLQEILTMDSHDVSVFYNAESALHALDNNFFDVAFIDVKLPGMNGVELFRIIKENTPDTDLFIISGFRITQIIEECTGIANTYILRETTNDTELYSYINSLDSIPMTLAIAESNNYIDNLHRQFKKLGKRPLLTSDNQLMNYNLNDYDILILNTSKPLIYGLVNFISLKNQGHNIPTVLVSDISINRHAHNQLHSFELTGCIFKPFQLNIILEIVDSIQNNKMSGNTIPCLNQP